MEKLMDKLVDWIDSKEERFVIGVSGHGAAGKTTFTEKLTQRLDNKEINYLNTDPYIVSSDIRKNAAIDYTYDGVPPRGASFGRVGKGRPDG